MNELKYCSGFSDDDDAATAAAAAAAAVQDHRCKRHLQWIRCSERDCMHTHTSIPVYTRIRGYEYRVRSHSRYRSSQSWRNTQLSSAQHMDSGSDSDKVDDSWYQNILTLPKTKLYYSTGVRTKVDPANPQTWNTNKSRTAAMSESVKRRATWWSSFEYNIYSKHTCDEILKVDSWDMKWPCVYGVWQDITRLALRILHCLRLHTMTRLGIYICLWWLLQRGRLCCRQPACTEYIPDGADLDLSWWLRYLYIGLV